MLNEEREKQEFTNIVKNQATKRILIYPFSYMAIEKSKVLKNLSLYLPKDDKIYQLEYTLKKKTTKERGLRPDAVVFGIEQKNNLAICEKKSSKC